MMVLFLARRLRHASAIAALSLGVAVSGCGASSNAIAIPASHPAAIAQHATFASPDSTQRLLYIAIGYSSPEVDVYPADIHIKNPHVIRKITAGITGPSGLWVDKAGTLYVVNAHGNATSNVVEYAAGTSSPSLTIPNILNAESVAVDDRGFVYVSGAGNFGNNSTPVKVFVFAPRSTKLVRTITMAGATDYDIPGGLAFDGKGDLFVGQLHRITRDYQITKVKPGAPQSTPFIDNAVGDAIAIDGAGNIYVGDPDSVAPAIIDVYAPGSKTPSRSIVGGAALSVASDGTLYGGYFGATEFDEYAPGAGSPTNSFPDGRHGADASAVSR